MKILQYAMQHLNRPSAFRILPDPRLSGTTKLDARLPLLVHIPAAPNRNHRHKSVGSVHVEAHPVNRHKANLFKGAGEWHPICQHQSKMFRERTRRVLIIEDDPTDREIYKRYLEPAGERQFEFEEADSAGVGLAIVKRSPPDCILLDYHLPDMDGLEFLGHLKDGSERHPCAVVMLTAYGGEALAVQAMKAGVMDYLPKRQANAEMLPIAISSAIDKFQLQREIEEQRRALETSARRYQTLLEAIPQMVWMAGEAGQLEYANRRWFEYTGVGAGELGRITWAEAVHPEDLDRTRAVWQQAASCGTVFEVEHRLRRASDQSYRWHLVRAVPIRDPSGEPVHWFGTCTEIEEQKQTEESRLERQMFESVGRLAGGIAHDFNNLLVTILGGASMASEDLPASHESQKWLEEVIRAGEQAAQLTRQMLAYAGKANLFVEPVDLNQLVQETCQRIRASLPPNLRLEYENSPDLPPVRTDVAQMRQCITDVIANAVEAIGENTGTVSVRLETVAVDDQLLCTNGFASQEMMAGRHIALQVDDTGCGMDRETIRRIFDPFFSTKSTGRGLSLAGVQGFVRSNRGGIHVDSTPGKGTRFRILFPEAETRDGLQRAGS